MMPFNAIGCATNFPLVAEMWPPLMATPMLITHGEQDEICSFREINAFYARAAEPKELVVIDGSDHLFNGVVSQVSDAVEQLLGDWNG